MTYQRLKQLTVIWIAGIILGSISPVEVKEVVGTKTRSQAMVAVEHASHVHQVVHLILFGVGAMLLSAVSMNTAQRIGSCLGLIALGCLLEVVQFVALGSRVLETWDMRDDAIAALAGLVLAGIIGFGAHARAQLRLETAAKP